MLHPLMRLKVPSRTQPKGAKRAQPGQITKKHHSAEWVKPAPPTNRASQAEQERWQRNNAPKSEGHGSFTSINEGNYCRSLLGDWFAFQ
jgi:hypothetical protein